MDRWVDGWMNGRVDGWGDECVEEGMDGWKDDAFHFRPSFQSSRFGGCPES